MNSNYTIYTGIIFIFVGCILNNVFLEYIVKIDATAGSFLTLAQFLFVTLEGLFGQLQWNAKTRHLSLSPPSIPLFKEPDLPIYRSWRTYGCMALVFFVVSLINY